MVFFFGKNAQLFRNLLSKDMQVHDITGKLCFACIGAGKHQKPVHQKCQPIDFLEHAPDDFAIGRLIAPAAQSDFANASDGRQWSSQFMRSVRGKVTHPFE